MAKQVFTTGQVPTAADFNSLAQDANMAATGGTIDGVAIGGTTKAAGGFTTVTAAGDLSLTSNKVNINGYVVSLHGAATLGWSSGLAGVNEITLARDAANTLAQRNGANAQTFRAYNTYTDASNYERGVFDWTTNANKLTIGTQSAGTGGNRGTRVQGYELVELWDTHYGFAMMSITSSTATFGVNIVILGSGSVTAGTLRTSTPYTVATLPAAGSAGRRAYVTDALAPTWMGALVGGGAVVTPVFDNGTAWVSA